MKERSGPLSRRINRGIDGLRDVYDRTLAALLGAAARSWPRCSPRCCSLRWSSTALTPTTFLPIEDRGRFITVIRTPEGATSAYTQRALAQVEKLYLAEPDIEGFFASIGMGFGSAPSSSVGRVFSRLRHWDERDVKQQALVAKLVPLLAEIPEALVFAINPPGLSRRSQADVEMVIKAPGASLDELAEVSARVVARMQQLPGLANADSDLRVENPQLDVIFDRERAADVGVPVASVADSLRLLIAQSPADEFVLRNEQYDVVMALEAPYRSVPEQLGEVHVRTQRGDDGAALGADRDAPAHRALHAEPLQPRARGDAHREPGAGRHARRRARARRGGGRRGAAGRLLERRCAAPRASSASPRSRSTSPSASRW